mmetsp:Transcript_67840/g.175836  ORF Transcript_67840/g.175836 Transcript_67840/m.175836 type:complete len:653 (+) Transcript_67840:121-2079(+)
MTQGTMGTGLGFVAASLMTIGLLSWLASNPAVTNSHGKGTLRAPISSGSGAQVAALAVVEQSHGPPGGAVAAIDTAPATAASGAAIEDGGHTTQQDASQPEQSEAKAAMVRLHRDFDARVAVVREVGADADLTDSTEEDSVSEVLAEAQALLRQWHLHAAEEHLESAVNKSRAWHLAAQRDHQPTARVDRAALSVGEALTRLGFFQARYGQPSVAVNPLQEAVHVVKALTETKQCGSAAWALLARAESAQGSALCEAGGEHGVVVGKARQHFQAAMDAVSQARRLEVGGASEKNFMVIDAQIHADFAECLADQSTSGNHDVDSVQAAMQEADRLAIAAGPATPGQPRVVMKLTKMRADFVHEESKFSKAVSLYDEYLAKGVSPVVGVEPYATIELFEVLQGQSIAMSSLEKHVEALALLDRLEDIQQSANTELHKRSGSTLECGSPDKRLWDSMARTYKIRADVLQAQSGERAPDAAVSAAQKAVDMLRHEGASQLGLMDALITLGNVNQSRRALQEALSAYREALDLGKNVLGQNDVMVASVLHNMGSASVAAGDYHQALRYFQETLAIEQSVLGAESAETVLTHLSIANAMALSGDHEAALQEAHRASEVEQLAHAEPDPQIRHLRQALRPLLLSSGRSSSEPRRPAATA